MHQQHAVRQKSAACNCPTREQPADVSTYAWEAYVGGPDEATYIPSKQAAIIHAG